MAPCLASTMASVSVASPRNAISSSSRSTFLSSFRLPEVSHQSPVSRLASQSITIECSSHPQKKCTAHHNKTRPKKHSLSDKNRKPPVYPKRPKAPPVVTLGWGNEESSSVPSVEPALAEA